MLNVTNKNNEPESKDILDLDLDMSIDENNGRYVVKLNSNYKLYETFETKKDATYKMFSIANERNKLESELREYL